MFRNGSVFSNACLGSLVAAGLIVGGCSGNGVVSQPTIVGPGSQSVRMNSISGSKAMLPTGKAAGTTVYALNLGGNSASVTVYSQGGAKLLRTLALGDSSGYLRTYYEMDASSAGLLYTQTPSSGDSHSPGLLSIYENNGTKKIASTSLPKNYSLLTVDASGNAYNQCGNHNVCEYSAKGKLVRKINASKNFGKGPVRALAVDQSGNLAIVADSAVKVFPPKSQTPTWTVDNPIQGSYNVSATFDSLGNLYVGNISNGDAVYVYAPGTTTPSLTIPNDAPNHLLCDASNNLYVLTGVNVQEYGLGQSIPKATITEGISYGASMALDSSGNLYVANIGYSNQSGSITEYDSATKALVQTITSGISGPVAVAVSPY
jgi:hypothetical protein